MSRFFAPLCILPLVLLAGGGPSAMARVPKPPFVLDCGPSGRERDDEWEFEEREAREESTVPRLRDVRYTTELGYGHEGGEGFHRWFAGSTTIWGRPERGLFVSGRSSPESYRIDLPAGKYIVALGFCELQEHLAGRRVFDIRMQDRTAWRGVDPFAIAGYGQSFRLARAVDVRGGDGLTIGLRRAPESRRSPFVSAIWVYPDAGTGEPPGPVSLRGFGSYGVNALFWDHSTRPDIAGYIVERRAPGDTEFRALTPDPAAVARWTDHDVSSDSACDYRVLAIDIRGRRGPPSLALSVAPRRLEASSLPVYSLTIADADLAALYRNVHEDHAVPATFSLGETSYPVRVRIRGAVSRFAAKLSYHVTFVERTPFGKRRVIYIKAEPSDYTLQQTKLTCDLFAALGTPAGDASYVNLVINGRYRGVYLDVERIDRAFLERKGMPGTLFRAGSFQHLGGEAGRQRGGRGSERELPELIRAINRIDRGEFESFVRAKTDWPVLRDYLAASTLCHRSEIEANDFFYCHVSGRRWILLPWDHNNGNFAVSGTRIGRPFMHLFGQTLQGSGHWNSYWYALASRIFHQKSLRRDYVDQLERTAREWLESGRVDQLIAANHAALRREIVVDPYRWPPGNDEPFERSADDLRRFARRHAAHLLEAIRTERLRPEPAVVINEFQLGPRGGWVELHNRGPTSVSLRGFSLGSLDGAYRAWHRFRRGDGLESGAFRVVEIEYAPRTRLAREEDDAEWREALERAELEGREPPRRPERLDGPPVPGGTVALVGRVSPPGDTRGRDDDARDRERPRRGDTDDRESEESGDVEPVLIDWYFFGHQTPGFSYGRVGDGFAFMRPTPGAVNSPRALEPPAVLADGGRRGHRGESVAVYALVEDSAPERFPRDVTLHYSLGGPWREVRMQIDTGSERPRFVARIQTATLTTEISYYFVARTDAGIERRAPLTAPVETYRHRIREDD